MAPEIPVARRKTHGLREYAGNVARALRGFATSDFYGSSGGISPVFADAESSAVVSCVAWIARQVVEPVLREHERDGTVVEDSRAVAAFYAPGGHGVTGRRLMKACASAWIVDGNAYLQIVRDARGLPADLIYRDPAQCAPVPDPATGVLRGYKIGATEHSPADVIHFADGVDPGAPLRGLSPLRRSLRAVMGDQEADRYSWEILTNPAILGLVFIPEIDPGPDNAQHMSSQLESRYGRGGRGGTLVCSVKGRFERPGLNPEQLALSSLRRDHEARIAGAIGVPAVVAQLGVGLEHSTFANYAEARAAATENVLAPLWAEWAEALTLQYLPQFPGSRDGFLAFDLSGVRALSESADGLDARVMGRWKARLIDRATALAELGYQPAPADAGLYFDGASGSSFSANAPDA